MLLRGGLAGRTAVVLAQANSALRLAGFYRSELDVRSFTGWDAMVAFILAMARHGGGRGEGGPSAIAHVGGVLASHLKDCSTVQSADRAAELLQQGKRLVNTAIETVPVTSA